MCCLSSPGIRWDFPRICSTLCWYCCIARCFSSDVMLAAGRGKLPPAPRTHICCSGSLWAVSFYFRPISVTETRFDDCCHFSIVCDKIVFFPAAQMILPIHTHFFVAWSVCLFIGLTFVGRICVSSLNRSTDVDATCGVQWLIVSHEGPWSLKKREYLGVDPTHKTCNYFRLYEKMIYNSPDEKI